MPNTGIPPPLPVEPKPPLPPEDPPANQPTSATSSYSTMPPKPVHAGYSTAPPVVAQQMPHQSTDLYSQRQTWQHNQLNTNKRPFPQNPEGEQNKRPLLERPKQWGNQKPNVNQWTNQPPPNISYNQPPPQTQPAPKPNIEELSEAEKKFDKEFAAWEAQFNKWKEQNASHPDKTQYMEYEKKWESWRNSLLERREQMRRKRLAMNAATAANKPPTFTQMPNTQQPVVDTSRASTGPAKLPSVSPVKQVTAPDVANNIPNLTNNPLPHQNNESLSFKTSQVPSEETGDFLKPSFSSGGGIPGLDLVKDDEPQKEDVIELDKEDKKTEEQPPPAKGPDFDAISKGINSILGDQKLLSMLSIVSQNPPSAPAPNTTTNSVSSITPVYPPEHNFSAPPPPHQFNEAPPSGNFSAPPPVYQHNEGPHSNLPSYNEQSNQSFDERSNHGENYQQRESVNNFDDQTRSSFTMGPTDQDVGYGVNNFSRNQLNKPNRFLGMPLSENDRGPIRPNFGTGTVRNNPNFGGAMPDNRKKFGPNDPGFGSNMSDNRNKFGLNPTFAANMPEKRNNFGPFRTDTGPGNFSKNSSLPLGNRGNNFYNEGFNRVALNNRQDFPVENNFKYGHNSSGNSFRRNNFDNANKFGNQRDNFGNNNFNRSGSFNEQNRYNEEFDKDDYGPGDYDDFENYNEDDDYEKYHQLFNEDDENTDAPHQNHRQGQGPQLGQRPPPPRLMDLPTEPPEPVPEDDLIFEPTTVVDYDHKSLRSCKCFIIYIHI